MAKSLRSKWKRKMKAIKRERYAVKELKQLKAILGNAENKDVDMSEICTVLPPGSLAKAENKKGQNTDNNNSSSEVLLGDNLTNAEDKSQNTDNASSSESKMEVVETKSKYHPVKLTDEKGNYPVWMSDRAIRKHKAKMTKRGKIQKKKRQNKRRT